MASYFDSSRPADDIIGGFERGASAIGDWMQRDQQYQRQQEAQSRPFAPAIQAKIRELLTQDKLNELMHPDADPIEIARRDRQGLMGVNPQASTPDIGYKDGRPQLQAPGAVSPWGGPQGPSAPQGPSGAFSKLQAGMTRGLGNLRADLGYGAPQGFSPDMLRTQQPPTQEPMPYVPSQARGGRMDQLAAPRPGMQSALPPRSSGGGSISLEDSDYKYSPRDLRGLEFVQGGIKAREANKAKTDAAKVKADADFARTRYTQNQLNSRFGSSSTLKAEALDDKMQQVMLEQEGANRRAALRDAAIRDALKLRGNGDVAKLIKSELDDASREYDTLFRDPMTVRTPEGQAALQRALERRTLAMEAIEDHLRNSGFEAESRGQGPKAGIGDKRPLAASPDNGERAIKSPSPQGAQAKPVIAEGARKTLSDGRRVVRRGGKWVQE